jgi:hypothetical protein
MPEQHPETSKGRATRIPLDYYRKQDWLRRSKFWLALLAVVPAIAWAGFNSMRSESFSSPGPVVTSHALWDHECAACHISFTGIRDDAIRLAGSPAHATDRKCQACHLGPQHDAHQLAHDVVGCASCHEDHRGRDASLTRIADAACTNCHADLLKHTTTPERVVDDSRTDLERRTVFGRVTAFDADHHPEFQSFRSDPSRLKFSHRRHLAPGLNFGEHDRFPAKRIRDLDPDDRQRYRSPGQTDDATIQLTCAACHTLEARETRPGHAESSSAFQTRSSGAYMAPITYEAHCRACHPLEFERHEEGEPMKLIRHGLAPHEIRDFLAGQYDRALLDPSPEMAVVPRPTSRPFPGKPAPPATIATRDAVRSQIAAADEFLRGRCLECHDLPGLPSQSATAPTHVPDVWLRHARFDHAAHRAVECRVCHTQDYLYDPRRSENGMALLDNQDVLMPKLEVCTQCHVAERAGKPGGARVDCVECHWYHGVDDAGSGRGAPDRGVTHAWEIKPFKQGSVDSHP